MAVSWLPKHRMRPSLSGRSLLYLFRCIRAPLLPPPRYVAGHGCILPPSSFIDVVGRTAARARSAQGASQFAAGYAAVRLPHHSCAHHENKVSYSSPVPVEIPRSTRDKTTPFAHVAFLLERHPESWTGLTPGRETKAAALSVKRDLGQRSVAKK